MLKTISEFCTYRFALANLLSKDFKVRYRNMSLGVLWSILNPLVMLSILVTLFTFIFPQRGIERFPVFLLIGLVLYNMANLSIPAATLCVMDNASIVKKVAFPRYILPLSVVFSQSVHVLIQLALVFVFAMIYSVAITRFWLWLPVVLLVELVFIMGAAMMVAALNVYFRDVRYITENGLAIFFWLSPIFYPLEAVTTQSRWWIGFMYQLNPLAGCIDAARRALLYAQHPDPVAFGMAAGVALVSFVAGLYTFKRMETYFSDLI